MCLDDAIGELVDAHPDVTLLLTADHFNPKRRRWTLAYALAAKEIGAEAVPIIKDRYVVHRTTLAAACSCIFTPATRRGQTTAAGILRRPLAWSACTAERRLRTSFGQL